MSLAKYDNLYCSVLGIFNPYKIFPYKLDNTIPMFDSTAYKQNPQHKFVYDKLFIAQSQFIPSGELSTAKDFPLFIKPRWGHKTSSSKDCYKIKSMEELQPFLHKKNMMWSSFIDAKESMTDFILINGEIVYQITYVYSEEQYGFADVWKLISSENKPPQEVVEWVQRHMTGYTGPLNVQYRDTVIIEVGLRFARSGMYIESTNNKQLVEAINHMWKTKTWTVREEITLTPFYSFKCWSPMPVLCLLPQHAIDILMVSGGSMNFYEYYFEPTGKHSTVFFQFLHKDFESGMKLKKRLETILLIMNLLFVFSVIGTMYYPKLIYVVLGLLVLSFMNSLIVIESQFSHQKQFIH